MCNVIVSTRTLCLSLIVSFYLSHGAIAAAWVQGKGVGQVITSFGSYTSTRYSDPGGHSKDSNNQFTKYEINPFFEYGLTDDVTIGVNPLLQYWQTKSIEKDFVTKSPGNCNFSIYTSGTLLESEFLIRKKIVQKDNAVVSLQPLVKIPCIKFEGSGASLIWNSYEVEMRMLAGYGFKWEADGRLRPFTGQYHFVNMEAAYRKKNGNFSDQIKIDGTLGFRYSKDTLLLAQLFSVISTGEEVFGSKEIGSNSFVPNIDNYYNVKLQFSSVVQFTQSSSIQLGFYSDIFGKNYGSGNGMIVSLWKGF